MRMLVVLRGVVPHHGPQLIEVEVWLVRRSGQQVLDVLAILIVTAIANDDRLRHPVELDHAPAAKAVEPAINAKKCDLGDVPHFPVEEEPVGRTRRSSVS